ncbi:MAG: TrkH family potassium uptake protein [Clostridia bacterium]|nr:TrkH family potassium uptake protein [Clostridia bacterium]
MNTKIIRYILGHVLRIEAAFMVLPFIIGLFDRERLTFVFLFVALGAFLVSILLTFKKPDDMVFYLKEGCVATAASWILMSIVGALPFCISGTIPSFTDALFETISGFTTTGASILNEVESMPRCYLFWRSFTHWIGGMGVLVFLLAVVPMSGGSHINLMRAESPGPSVGKFVPKVRHTARILYMIYFILTGIEVLLLMFGGMGFLDSAMTSFATAGTGGFGIKNDSFMSFTPYSQWVVAIFMIMFGMNFNIYYLLLFRQFKKAFSIEEIHYYLLIIVGAIAIIFFNIKDMFATPFEAMTHTVFQVSSIISSTGFSSADFNLWPNVCKVVLVILMFVGACAGSTGGGIKVTRLVVLIKTIGKELKNYIHPKRVSKVKMDGKPVEHEVVRAINVFFITFMIIFFTSILLISIENYDFATNFSAVLATMNNIGPGLNLVGPTSNFSFFNHFSKYVLMFDMLAGRLELFPLLILFHPGLYVDTVKSKMHRRANKQND